ncbi:exonuclease VII small subunit [Candidatus Pelagibacter sp.]|nr:exonuclease VII small subunit [Candidatus Pelagibacter sp.]
MKEKNIPNNYNTLSVDELTNLADNMIEDLENQKDLDVSIEKYQKLLKLNNFIEKKFKDNVKNIKEKTEEKISKIKSRINAKKAK